MLMYHAEQRAQARAKADVIEAVAFGYGGARGGKDGAATRAMQRMVELLRNG